MNTGTLPTVPSKRPAWARGGPIHETDLDFVVKREDVERAIDALATAGLERKATLEMARMLREQIDWDELRRRCEDYAYAKPSFTLAEELGVIERPDGEVVDAEHVRQAQESRHGP